MEEPGKPNAFEQRELKRLQVKEETEQRLVKIRIETRKWLESDPKVKEYFQPFFPSTVHSFFDHYAHIKSYYMEYGDRLGKIQENHEIRHIEAARKALKAILVKKFHDLRRLWGAEQIQLEGIRCCPDFEEISGNLFSLPWLNPITEEELNLFITFLEKSDLESTRPDYDWQSRHPFTYLAEIKPGKKEDENDEPDTWFEFHNLYTGADRYLLLPDIRGEKEKHYREAAREKKEAVLAERTEENPSPTKYSPDNRPVLFFLRSEVIEAFIKEFEPPQNLTRYRHYLSSKKESHNWPKEEIWLNEKLKFEVLQNLLNIGHTLPIEAGTDWRESLYRVWLSYERDRLVGALTQVYEDYLFYYESGLPFEAPEKSYLEDVIESIRKQILDGREFLGEPRDFNF